MPGIFGHVVATARYLGVTECELGPRVKRRKSSRKKSGGTERRTGRPTDAVLSRCEASARQLLILTCRGDPREDPALAVADGNAVGRVVLLQDVHAAAPRSGRNAIRVGAGPVPHQDAEVILGVDLRREPGG